MRFNLDSATNTDLREIHAFLHAARIASVGADMTGVGKNSIREHVRKMMVAVEAEMIRREMTPPPHDLGEQIYGRGCNIIDRMATA